ncbi:unnamed protein product [Gongylonema pulchrum]|uniref:WD_REPEATS_REGION domain-containing protein n=1 Tax=Gongylonema pulchrum TaxID=637853 RepID=A0A183CVE6_9BILA|nr:unnamed protein product [Gongylonema pulchrum]
MIVSVVEQPFWYSEKAISRNKKHIFLRNFRGCLQDAEPLHSFQNHSDFVTDVAWSPVHPAVFASADASGNVFLWNLNENTGAPISEAQTERGYGVRKMRWIQDGQCGYFA